MPIYNFSEYIKIIRPIPDNWPKDIYGIPYVKKTNIDISNINNGKWLISLNNAASNKKIKIAKSFIVLCTTKFYLNYLMTQLKC